MKNVTLQSIFQMAYGAFETSHRLPYYVRAAARAIMACRTAVLGGHIQACPDGHYQRQWYNSLTLIKTDPPILIKTNPSIFKLAKCSAI